MSPEIGFVKTHRLIALGAHAGLQFGDAVYQKKRVAVRQNLLNFFDSSVEVEFNYINSIGENEERKELINIKETEDDFNEIRRIADKYNLFVLEDAAQGFGGTIGGKKACSFGDVAGTSFFPAKPLGCYGDGGAIFTNSDELYAKMKSIHVHGQGSDKYDNIQIGLNSRLDTIQGAVLIEKLNIFDDELVKRNHVADYYTRELKDIVETPVVPEGYGSSWAQFTLKLKSTEEREKLIKTLNDNGIPAMVYYPIPMHKSTAYASANEGVVLEECEKLSKTVMSLPMHPYLTDDELKMICDVVKSAY